MFINFLVWYWEDKPGFYNFLKNEILCKFMGQCYEV